MSKALPESRPVWDFEIAEDTMRWIKDHRVTTLVSRWKMKGVDSSVSWIEMRTNDGETMDVFGSLFSKRSIWHYVELDTLASHTILKLTHFGKRAMERLGEIDEFDERHAAELAEYQRLKAKFEGVD